MVAFSNNDLDIVAWWNLLSFSENDKYFPFIVFANIHLGLSSIFFLNAKSILSKLSCILIINEKDIEISIIKIFMKKILKNFKNKRKYKNEFEQIIYKDANYLMFKLIKNEK